MVFRAGPENLRTNRLPSISGSRVERRGGKVPGTRKDKQPGTPPRSIPGREKPHNHLLCSQIDSLYAIHHKTGPVPRQQLLHPVRQGFGTVTTELSVFKRLSRIERSVTVSPIRCLGWLENR